MSKYILVHSAGYGKDICHYGVKGMKWGIINEKDELDDPKKPSKYQVNSSLNKGFNPDKYNRIKEIQKTNDPENKLYNGTDINFAKMTTKDAKKKIKDLIIQDSMTSSKYYRDPKVLRDEAKEVETMHGSFKCIDGKITTKDFSDILNEIADEFEKQGNRVKIANNGVTSINSKTYKELGKKSAGITKPKKGPESIIKTNDKTISKYNTTKSNSGAKSASQLKGYNIGSNANYKVEKLIKRTTTKDKKKPNKGI